ncbi:MAG: glycosyltransferase [candidate division KSB1 bacterium]|nr:glycosyltransferase [candidate division KSB1 bacterium]MDZ7368471.1 glycosyltransferase [candidate division KSB1 bacterium]MDZ7406197.1 glycosyltransferase [candidate division KSB1 bacterium]
MRIIIVSTAYPLRGGIAHYNALLASHLSRRHTVEIITFKRQYPKLFFPGKSQEESGGSFPQDGITPAPQWVDSINPLNWMRVAREIRRRKPDVLIFKYWLPFFGPCFGTIARLAKRGTKIKVLFICDNVIPHERRLGDVALTRYAFKPADYFIVQSDAVEKDLLQHFPDAIYRKAPHPVYEIFGAPMAKSAARKALGITARNVILYFGYIRPYKGVMVLLEAMAKLRQSQSEIGETLLLVVGEFYDDEQKYRRRGRELNLDSCLRFVANYVPTAEVAAYFSAADVVVLPYLSATQSGIAQIAYHFDKPVIATEVGGLTEVVIHEKTGFLAPRNDAPALAESIRRFYREHRENEFSENVKVEKQKYSWDRVVEAIEALVR